MKIQLYSIRQVTTVCAVALVTLVGCVLYVRSRLSEESPEFALVLYIFIAMAGLFVIMRTLTLPSRVWVQVDAESISWRSARVGVKQGASPSGGVPVSEVVSATVVPQVLIIKILWRSTQVEGCAVQLELQDGQKIILPIRVAGASNGSQPMRELIAVLQQNCATAVASQLNSVTI